METEVTTMSQKDLKGKTLEGLKGLKSQRGFQRRLKTPIILASTSPRRVFLMNQVSIPVEVCAPETEEQPKKGEKPHALVSRLAREKAESVRDRVLKQYQRSLVIAADTLVVAPRGNQILGKPKDRKEAIQMLKALAGRTHEVMTGYCALLASRRGPDRKLVRVVRSKVKMRSLTQEMIELYVDSGEPMDKAGSYAAQGMGMALIERIDGSYTNVIGLPISQVLMDLEKTFKISLFSWTKSD